MSKNIFIISKPLQYFNATNIDVIGSKICLLVDNFYNAEKIFNKIKKESSYWNDIYFFPHWKDAYNWIHENKKDIHNFFIDSDFGFKKSYDLRILKKNNIDIYVYEEGLGNYKIKKLRSSGFITNLINTFSKKLGHENYLGGSKYTKGIFLYDPAKFKLINPDCKKEIHPFKEPFRKHLESFRDKRLFMDEHTETVIEQEFIGKKVLLYLSSWEISSDINKLLEEYPEYLKVMKPHPHIKSHNIFFNIFDYIFAGSDLGELLIAKLLQVCEEIIIIHHGTSALMYFQEEPKLKSLKI